MDTTTSALGDACATDIEEASQCDGGKPRVRPLLTIERGHCRASLDTTAAPRNVARREKDAIHSGKTSKRTSATHDTTGGTVIIDGR